MAVTIGKFAWSVMIRCAVSKSNQIFLSRALTHSFLDQEVRGSNLGLVKSDTVLPMAQHHCDISWKEAVFPGRNDTEMGPAKLLNALAYYSKYNDAHYISPNTRTWVGNLFTSQATSRPSKVPAGCQNLWNKVNSKIYHFTANLLKTEKKKKKGLSHNLRWFQTSVFQKPNANERGGRIYRT